MGDIVLDNGEKKETAKGLTEEELTGALVRVEKNGAKTVCFVNGDGEHTLDDTGRDGYSTLKDALEKNNYKTDTISLIEKPDIPKTCSVVVVGGPKHDYLQPAIDALKTFVTGGRPRNLQLRSGPEPAGAEDGRDAESRRSGRAVGHHAEWRRHPRPEFGQPPVRTDFPGGGLLRTASDHTRDGGTTRRCFRSLAVSK